MPHEIHVPLTKTKNFRHNDIEADATVTCFPNGFVEYRMNFLRVNPGCIFKITIQAMYFKRGRYVNASRQATFFSNKMTVEGVPQGNFPHSGRSLPSEAAIHGVNDFQLSGGVTRIKNL